MKSVKVCSIKILLMMISMIFIAGCGGSNKIITSWINPEATKESVRFKLVGVFGLVNNADVRKTIEETIAMQMVNTLAVPSYKIVSDDEMSNPDNVKNKLSEKGYDGAIIIRLVNIEQRQSYSYGMYPNYYYSFGGYYNYSYGYMYDYGGAYATDQVVTLEINIYSLKEDKLIWTCETKSFNPQDVNQTIIEISQAVKNQLIEDGLLENQPE